MHELVRIAEAIHRDTNIDKEIVFECIEAALVSAAKTHYGEEADIHVEIDRGNGAIRATHNGGPTDVFAKVEQIPAQTIKDLTVQKIREVMQREHG